MTSRSRRLFSRHRLLVTVGFLAFLFAVSVIQNASIITAEPPAPAEVAIIHTNTNPNNISDAEIAQMVRDAVAAAGGLEAIISPGDKVLVHPNIVNTAFPSGGGVVTDRRVTQEVVRIAQELTGSTGEVIIAEGSALWGPFEEDPNHSFGPYGVTEECFHDAGYDLNRDGLDDETGVRLVDLNNAGGTYDNFPGNTTPYNTDYVTGVTVQNGLLRSQYWLPNDLMNADVVINVPVFKNHELAGTTGSLKLAVGVAPADIYHFIDNSWGAYGYMKWALLHQGVKSWDNISYSEYEQNARVIVDLNRCRRPDFTVTDAIWGVTNGPVGHGQGYIAKQPMGCILAGRDPVAVDTIQALMQGLDPAGIRHIVLASQSVDIHGVALGTMDTSQITVKGAHVAAVRKEFTQLDPTDSDWRNHTPADAVPPTVGSVYPADGAVVSGTVSVTAAGVADNRGISNLLRAELYVDGKLVGSDKLLENSAYNISWDSTTVADGTHELKICVYDKFLNENVIRDTYGNIIGYGVTRTVTVNNSGNRVANALSQADGTNISLGQLVVTAPTMNGYFYAELPDRTMGIKIASSTVLSEGNLIDVTGTMAGAGVERYLNASVVNIVNPSVTVPAPFAMGNLSLGGVELNALTPGAIHGIGPFNLGLLVKTWGNVTSTGDDYFFISDGSKLPDGSPVPVMVKCGSFTKPTPGEMVSVTGISIPVGSPAARGILIRKQSDIVLHPRP